MVDYSFESQLYTTTIPGIHDEDCPVPMKSSFSRVRNAKLNEKRLKDGWFLHNIYFTTNVLAVLKQKTLDMMPPKGREGI